MRIVRPSDLLLVEEGDGYYENDDEDDNEDNENENDDEDGEEQDEESNEREVIMRKLRGMKELASLSGGFLPNVGKSNRSKKTDRSLGAYLTDRNSELQQIDRHNDNVNFIIHNNNNNKKLINPISNYYEKIELVGLTLYDIYRDKRCLPSCYNLKHQDYLLNQVSSMGNNQDDEEEDMNNLKHNHRIAINIKKINSELTCPICLGILRNTVEKTRTQL